MIDSLMALWDRLDYRALTVIKCGVAVGATLLLTWDLGSAAEARFRRLRPLLLSGLGVVALACWWELGHFHFPTYLQVHEHYHYYLGAKYFPELEYTRLYQCTAVADVEAGLRQQVVRLWIRDLSTNRLTPAKDIISNPASCTSHFTPARWEMFKRDVGWFRSHRTPELWAEALVDHGYNGTPVWAVAATLLIPNRPANDTDIFLLALLDPLLILTMWAFAWWAFGWQATCIAMIWWGTNSLSTYLFTGGAFLRADWVALSVIGVCLVKRGRPALGGFALTYAALLRIFPVLIMVGLGLKVAMRMWRQRSFHLEPAHRAFAMGGVTAALMLTALSFIVVGRGVTGGVRAWEGFVENSRKHLSTPLTNNVGLKTVLSFSPSTRAAVIGEFWLDTPWDTWSEARHRVFEQRQPVYWLLLIAFIALLARVVAEQEDWVALVLGTALVPVATELTCYYYSVFLLFAFLWRKWEWSGAALCALSALLLLIPVIVRGADDAYTALSVATLLYVATVTGAILFASGTTETFLSGIGTDHANTGYQKSAQTERSV
jgi:hypothetical protein